jgi:hypothetical protein
VLLLKSLFCLTGSDNRRRFIAIHLSCYFLFSVFSSVLSFSGLLSFLTLFCFVGTSALSTKRRLNDANLNINWLWAPTGSFFVAGIIIIISGYNTSYWLLLFPLVNSTLLMTYKSKKNNHILGYCGNVDLSSYIKQNDNQHQNRIEPTFNRNDVEQSQSTTYRGESSSFVPNEDKSKGSNYKPDDDIGEVIRLKLFNNKNAVLAITILISFVIMAMILTSIISTFDEEKLSTPKKNNITIEPAAIKTLLHEVTLPDNFTLFVSSFNGMTISWEGDKTKSGFIWQQLTAQGDDSCIAITYNNGEMIRTMDVIQETNGDYLASFSPLDTKALIRNIAIRSSFTLCGYKFSLKGSQSTLGKHTYYSELISN